MDQTVNTGKGCVWALHEARTEGRVAGASLGLPVCDQSLLLASHIDVRGGHTHPRTRVRFTILRMREFSLWTGHR